MTPDADPRALIAAIAADRDSDEPWLVYADWLLEHGDPVGELISLEIAIARGQATADAHPRVQALRAQHDAELVVHELDHGLHWDLAWWRGLIWRAWLRPQKVSTRESLTRRDRVHVDTDAIHALFADTRACALDALDVHFRDAFETGTAGPPAPAIVDAILAAKRPCRELRVVDLGARANRLRHAMPFLRVLGLDCSTPDTAVRELAHAELRTLVCSTRACPAIVDGTDLPNLERLRWLFEHGDHSLFTSPTALASRPPPSLVELEIASQAPGYADTIEYLAGTPLAAQLRALSISWASLEQVEALSRCRAAFPQLEHLELDVTLPEILRARVEPRRRILEPTLPGGHKRFYWRYTRGGYAVAPADVTM